MRTKRIYVILLVIGTIGRPDDDSLCDNQLAPSYPKHCGYVEDRLSLSRPECRMGHGIWGQRCCRCTSLPPRISCQFNI